MPFLRAAGKPVDSENLKISAGLATARECIAGAKKCCSFAMPRTHATDVLESMLLGGFEYDQH